MVQFTQLFPNTPIKEYKSRDTLSIGFMSYIVFRKWIKMIKDEDDDGDVFILILECKIAFFMDTFLKSVHHHAYVTHHS